MQYKFVILMMFIAAMAACDRSASKLSEPLMLVFGDKEEEVEPYQTRIIITPEFMRFDDGEGATDFVLLNRIEKKIYSVVQSNKTVTIIQSEDQDVKSPFDLKLSSKKIDDMQDAPSMEGIKPQHHVYMSGDQICFEVVTVPGFLPEYVQAMSEFNQILANDGKLTLNNMPADMQNGCSLAKTVFEPNRHLKDGFPVQLWGPDGTQSVLLDFKRNFEADKTLFEIPSSYESLNIMDIRAKFAK
ncbi:MAG: hypothetical protein OEY52_13405 [Gammaproteobacteria bacterium]|nr:hypothetical protein [Gammaproteobacteria bacterium]